MPIKASSLPSKPTLKRLKEDFLRNERSRKPYQNRLKTQIDWVFHQHPKISLQDLKSILRSKGIDLILRQNREGVLYGLTYVDHHTKCVFNGSTLGKDYSAKAMLERLENSMLRPNKSNHLHPQKQVNDLKNVAKQVSLMNPQESLLTTILQPEYVQGVMPYELKGKRKRKKRKSSSHL